MDALTRQQRGHTLTPEQRRVVRLGGGPARVLAGAGSGKTRTITELILRRVHRHDGDPEEGTPANRILALTFTVNAAAEMRRRTLEALKKKNLYRQGLELEVSNFHSLALEIVHANAGRSGADPDLPVLGAGRAWFMVTDLLKDPGLSLKRLDLAEPARAAKKVLGLLSAAKNELADPGALRLRTQADLLELERRLASGKLKDGEKMRACFEERLDLLALAERFEVERRRRGLLRFEDMLVEAVGVLEDPDAAYGDRYDLVVVDEFQDTNPAQFRLVELLAGGDLSKVVVVGDDLQSIFNFQGATIRNIQRFEERAGGRVGDATYPLSVNFRSGRRILAFANHVARAVHPPNSPDPAKVLSAPDGATEGAVHAFQEASDTAEAAGIARRIKALLDSTEAEPSGCAVLVRRWRQAIPILAALSDAEVPCEAAVGGDPLSDPTVGLFVCYLRLVADPGDRRSLQRVLTGHPVLLGDGDLEAFFASASGVTGGPRAALAPRAVDGMPGLSEAARARLRELAVVLDGLEGELSRGEALGDFVERAVEVTGLGHELRSSPRAEAGLVVRYLEMLREAAGEFGDVRALPRFLDYVRVMEDSKDQNLVAPPTDDPGTVKVTTIHKAKGLEFDHVFVPGLSEGLFPSGRSADSPLTTSRALPPPLARDPDPEAVAAYEDLDSGAMKDLLARGAREEEGRLFYVACTRAKESLTLSRAHYYGTNKDPNNKPGKRKDAPPSYWEVALAAPEECALEVENADLPVPAENPNHAAPSRDGRPPGDDRPLRAAVLGDDASVAAGLGVPSGWEEELAAQRARVAAIPDRPAPRHLLPTPAAHSPSSLMEYEVCPRRYYYTHVFPVPRANPGMSAVLEHGTRVHLYVEGGMRGVPPSEPATGENGGAGSTAGSPVASWAERWEGFRRSPYGRMVEESELREMDAGTLPGALSGGLAGDPFWVSEVPFEVEVGGKKVRGRMDALLVGNGLVHLVDWKTGRPDETRYASRLQLPIYALAANRLWNVAPENMRAAYVFVPGGEEIGIDLTGETLREAEERATRAVAAIGERSFSPIPSAYACGACPVFGVGIEGCPKDESEVPADEAPPPDPDGKTR